MDEKLRTEDLVTQNNNPINTDDILENSVINEQIPEQLHNTKYLLGSDIVNDSKIKLNNNTMNLLNDKTSLMYESKKKHEEILPTEDLLKNNDDLDFLKSVSKSYLVGDRNAMSNNFSKNEDLELQCKTSFLLEESDNRFIKNLNRNSNQNVNRNKESGNSLSISEDGKENLFIVTPSIIKFPVGFPGETLNFVFKIKNNLKKAISIDFTFVLKEKQILKDLVERHFPQYQGVFDNFENSQAKYNCFRINSAATESIPVYTDRDYEVRLELPQCQHKEELFSLLQITANFNDKVMYHFVPIIASIEQPKLLCLRDAVNDKLRSPILSIQLTSQARTQKIKIPFRNISIKELDIEFYFEQEQPSQNLIVVSDSAYQVQIILLPNKLLIQSYSTCCLELIVKLSRLNNSSLSLNKGKNSVRKILTGVLRGCKVVYTFFVEAFFI